MPAGKVSSKDISDVLRGLKEDGQSAGTIRNYRAMISAVFAYGIKQKHIVSNPVLETRQPPAERDRLRFLSNHEEQSMREKIREHWPEREAEFDLALHSGMRSGQAYKLTWDRVDLDRGIIDVPTGGKTGWRQIPLNSVCRKALETLHRQSKGSEFVIPRCGGPEGENWKLGEWFRDVIEKAGVLPACRPFTNNRWTRCAPAESELRHVRFARCVNVTTE